MGHITVAFKLEYVLCTAPFCCTHVMACHKEIAVAFRLQCAAHSKLGCESLEVRKELDPDNDPPRCSGCQQLRLLIHVNAYSAEGRLL